jgi:hypothetical protein
VNEENAKKFFYYFRPVSYEVASAIPMKLACMYKHAGDLGYKTLELGTHTLFVGEFLDIKAEEGLSDGSILDIEKVDPPDFQSRRTIPPGGPGFGSSLFHRKKV